ncbi:MAG: corrinoid protein [candidate division WOR-3 bacterium]
MHEPDELLKLLADAVVAMKPERVAELARLALEQGVSAEQAINQGLAAGMRRMGEKFAARECFVPEVLLASRAMYVGFEILQKKLTDGGRELVSRGRVVLGVVQGDIHDIGKNIVKVMTQAAGYEVIDLGRNVNLPEFVRAVEQYQPLVLGMSSLMTTTMPRMGTVIEMLDKAGLRNQVKVIVGGAPTTAEFARRIGADSWARDAHSAVEEVRRLAQGPGT